MCLCRESISLGSAVMAATPYLGICRNADVTISEWLF